MISPVSFGLAAVSEVVSKACCYCMGHKDACHLSWRLRIASRAGHTGLGIGLWYANVAHMAASFSFCASGSVPWFETSADFDMVMFNIFLCWLLARLLEPSVR